MNNPSPPSGPSGARTIPRKYVVALLIAAGFLLSWIFSAYLSPQIMIDFVMRYCA
ncbi:MAG: hypothetical protein WCD07_04505 [Burkholderiales bacterium]